MTPDDLLNLDCHEVSDRLFGRTPSAEDSWSLERIEEKKFRLVEKRLRLSLTVSAGYLVALHEVGSYQHAIEFGQRNNIRVMQDRGIFLRGTAELAIKCDGVPPISSIGEEPYKIDFSDGIEVSISHASFLFQRLVAGPSAEVNLGLPEPSVITTLVMTGVDVDNAAHIAEKSLYVLRNHCPDASFDFIPLTSKDVIGASLEGLSNMPRIFAMDFSTSHPWAIAFFNRATESEPFAAFLYYYRVLEACFDQVIEIKLNSWRANSSLDAAGLLKEVRSLARAEDITALRQVLGQIVDQALLDDALEKTLLDAASVDDLTTQIYLRRNEIAHGRRGQHKKVLVPYSFPMNSSAERDLNWLKVMRSLAGRAIDQWLRV